MKNKTKNRDRYWYFTYIFSQGTSEKLGAGVLVEKNENDALLAVFMSIKHFNINAKILTFQEIDKETYKEFRKTEKKLVQNKEISQEIKGDEKYWYATCIYETQDNKIPKYQL